MIITRNFLAYSEHSWGRRRFDICRQKTKKKIREFLFHNFFPSWKTLNFYQHKKSKIFFGSNQPSIFCTSQISLFFYDLKISTSWYKNAQRSFKWSLEQMGYIIIINTPEVENYPVLADQIEHYFATFYFSIQWFYLTLRWKKRIFSELRKSGLQYIPIPGIYYSA